MHATKMHAAPSAAGQAGVRGAPRLGADRTWTRVAAARPLKPARVVRVGSFSDSRKPAGQAGSRKFFNSAANEVRRKTPSRDARDAFIAHRNRWTFDTTSKDADRVAFHPTLPQADAARKVSASAISEPVVADEPRASTSVDDDVRRNLQPSSVVPERRRRVNPAPNPVTMDKVGAVVLAGGADSNNPLTRNQARAALRFGATYRLIDFPIANCINSKVRRVFVMTQWNSHTLNQHVNAAYPPEVFGFGEQGCVPGIPNPEPNPTRRFEARPFPRPPNNQRHLPPCLQTQICYTPLGFSSHQKNSITHRPYRAPSRVVSRRKLTQSPPRSLHHRSVDVLPSNQTVREKSWSLGSADCVRRHLQSGALQGPGQWEPDAYLVLSGEALYRMDYQDMLKTHNETGADITIGVSKQRVGDVDATNLGICSVYSDDTQVYGFREKPSQTELREMAQCPSAQTSLDDCNVHVNMGVYIFSRRAMKELVEVIEHIDEGTQLDFGRDILPMAIATDYQIHAHEHGGFWQPVRNLREWYESNISICSPHLFRKMYAGASDLIDVSKDPVFTVPRTLPPARFSGESQCDSSLISDGVVVANGCVIKDSVVGPCVVFGEGVSVERVVFNGHPEMAHIHGNDVPDVGAGSVVYGCVVQSDVLIGAGCVLTNEKRVKKAEVIDDEGHGYIIDDGIITILEGTVLAAGTVI